MLATSWFYAVEPVAVNLRGMRSPSSSATRTEAGGSARSPSACEHVFVTSEESAGSRFARAVRARNLFLAETAAFEMATLSLRDALALVVLYGEGQDDKFEKAAVRWLGRLLLEKPLPLSLAARCVELVAELRGPGAEQAPFHDEKRLWLRKRRKSASSSATR